MSLPQIPERLQEFIFCVVVAVWIFSFILNAYNYVDMTTRSRARIMMASLFFGWLTIPITLGWLSWHLMRLVFSATKDAELLPKFESKTKLIERGAGQVSIAPLEGGEVSIADGAGGLSLAEGGKR